MNVIPETHRVYLITYLRLYDYNLHLDRQRRSVVYETMPKQKHNFYFPIVNFLFICSNIPTSSACAVYISQLI